MKLFVTIFFILTLLSYAVGETHIMGDITKVVFDAEGNPYIVEQEISVPAGRSVAIGEGCVFLFKPSTGLIVDGTLLVEGNSKMPVIFTSFSDKDFNTSADKLLNDTPWLGITITKDAKDVSMKDFELRLSANGLNSQTNNIVLENALFMNNSQSNCSINGVEQNVQDNALFNYQVRSNNVTIKKIENERTNEAVDSLVMDGRSYHSSNRKRTTLFQGTLMVHNMFSTEYGFGGVMDIGAIIGRNFIGATIGGSYIGPAVGVKYYYELQAKSRIMHIDIGTEAGWYADFGWGDRLYYVGPGVQLRFGEAPVMFVIQNHLLIGDGVAFHCNAGILLKL